MAVAIITTVVLSPSNSNNSDKDSATISRLLNASSSSKNRDVPMAPTAPSLMDLLSCAQSLATRATLATSPEVAVGVAATAVEGSTIAEVEVT